MGVRDGDDLHGTYAAFYYWDSMSEDGAYYGIRRGPYTTDHTKNGLTFKHIADSERMAAEKLIDVHRFSACRLEPVNCNAPHCCCDDQCVRADDNDSPRGGGLAR